MKVTIKQFGPIENIELEIKDMTVLTGFQSSGKSTIAKSIYFFRTLKDKIADFIPNNTEEYKKNISLDDITVTPVKKYLDNIIKERFRDVFGSSFDFDPDMCLRCDYSNETEKYIEVYLEEDPLKILDKVVKVNISESLMDGIIQIDLFSKEKKLTVENKEKIRSDIDKLFEDKYRSFYIPAGRSMLTILGDQLPYFFGNLTDRSKRNIDGATMDFINHIFEIRSLFANGLEGVKKSFFVNNLILDDEARLNIAVSFDEAIDISNKILKGKYFVKNGEERLQISEGHSVKMNYASSGQQEVLWIINFLFYYMHNGPINFIIEEPESHLFPATQKFLMEFISFVSHCGNQMLITTHSPYILASSNNMIYAYCINERYPGKADKIEQIIPRKFQLDWHKIGTFFVENGSMKDIVDPEIHEMDQNSLDGISGVLNEDYDKLIAIDVEDE